MKVLITGSTGLLGRSIVDEFSKKNWECCKCGFSRAGNDVHKLDLTNKYLVEKFVFQHLPHVIVHCAAERRPDVAAANLEYATKLNVDSAHYFAEIAKKTESLLVFISTDYVFDGTNPPYNANSKPNPLNFYGLTKYKAEQSILSTNRKAVILRIPVLYGPSDNYSESAILELINSVKKPGPVEMDHIGIRYPTCTLDVARVVQQVAAKYIAENWQKNDLPSVLQFTANQKFTKYQISLMFCKLMGISDTHLVPITKESGIAKRPKDCHLDISQLLDLQIDCDTVDFQDWCIKNIF